MGQDLNKIKIAYDIVAREYSEEFFGEHEKKPCDQEILGKFVKQLKDRHPVWDIGCGPGQTVRYLNGLGLQASGLDLSPRVIRQARLNCPGLEFRTGNMLDLDFSSNSVAGIISFYAIVHFTQEQVKQAFSEFFRILQPGGLFLLAFHIGEETLHLDEFLGRPIDVDFMLFTTEFISGCLHNAGFRDLDISEREPLPDVEYESRRAYIFSRKPSKHTSPKTG